MGEAGHGEVTELLLAWSGGEASALDKVMPLVYAELHRLARLRLWHERADHTLQASELINEAYLRLVDTGRVNWQDRAHFLAVSAQAMRRVLVEHARARGSQRRGAGVQGLPLEAAANVHVQQSTDLVKVDEALTALAGEHPRRAQVIELRFFGGLSVEETAKVLGVSEDTVLRDWRLARIWLLRTMSGEGAHAG
ncbi:MAG: sigma-70 family RNA polymerase sigma factor [Bryobacteraceae bacterium]|jgi:RNA polymerase sigma factor (TIGR02999 family)